MYKAPLYRDDITEAELQKWADDPECKNAADCRAMLQRSRDAHFAAEQKKRVSAALNKAEMESNPFNPRTEVSADARHIASKIVSHLWLIMIVLPVVLGILYAIVR